MFNLEKKVILYSVLAVCAFSIPASAQTLEDFPPQPEGQQLVSVPTVAEPQVQQQTQLQGGVLPMTELPKVEANATAEEIARINERLAVLSARLAELDLKAQIASKLAEIDGVSSLAPSESNPTSMDIKQIPSVPQMPIGLPLSSGREPEVQEVTGVDGDLQAVLKTENGSTQTVRVGDLVSGWSVMDVQIDTVKLKKGSKTLKLTLGNYIVPISSDVSGAGDQIPVSIADQ